MAATAPSLLTEPFGIDDLLMRICVDLQLDDTRHGLANTHYQGAWKWLEADGSPVAALKPTIYPHGSMKLGTTVRPPMGEEYDLDFVCELACHPTYFAHPVAALDLIERRLRDRDIYRTMIERMNRCIRLNYEHDFHMDILPACRDPKNGGTCILVPDRKLEEWKPSNPKGYVAWFNSRSHQLRLDELLHKAEAIPAQEGAEEKSALKLCVQLLKRWRDLRYKSDCDVAPISIVLTTLAADVYQGERSIAQALADILSGISARNRTSYSRVKVLNPSNTGEDLSEKWDSNPEAYREFVRGISEFEAQWKAVMQTRGLDRVCRILENLFGEEITKKVVEKQARDIEAARSRGELGMKKGSGIIAGLAGAAVIPVRRNTFYGDEG